MRSFQKQGRRLERTVSPCLPRRGDGRAPAGTSGAGAAWATAATAGLAAAAASVRPPECGTAAANGRPFPTSQRLARRGCNPRQVLAQVVTTDTDAHSYRFPCRFFRTSYCCLRILPTRFADQLAYLVQAPSGFRGASGDRSASRVRHQPAFPAKRRKSALRPVAREASAGRRTAPEPAGKINAWPARPPATLPNPAHMPYRPESR